VLRLPSFAQMYFGPVGPRARQLVQYFHALPGTPRKV
jgi:hypothetical protein